MVRLKHRYIVGQILFDPSLSTQPSLPAVPASSSSSSSSSSSNPSSLMEISSRDLNATLLDTIQRLYGDIGTGTFGMGTTGVKFMDPISSIYVVRTSREDLERVQFALTCINEVKRGGLNNNSNSSNSMISSSSSSSRCSVNNIVLRTLDIAGSMRTCKEKLHQNLCTYANVFSLSEDIFSHYNALMERLDV